MMVTLVNDRAELPACSCVSPRRWSISPEPAV